MKFISVSLLLFFFSCSEVKRHAPADKSTPSVDTARTIKHLAEDRLGEKRTEDGLDSSGYAPLLKYVFELARKNWHKPVYKFSFDTVTHDGAYAVTIDIQIGNLFDKQQKNLLTRLHIYGGAITTVYTWKKDSFEPLLENDHSDLTYIGDTAKDVNGDAYKDFLVHWYPSSGCCRRNSYTVYLYLPDKKIFSRDYQFINPTFFPKEKIIRGVEYGHQEEVGVYKYRWDGLKVDTIEFVYPLINHEGYYIKTKKQLYRPTEKDGLKVKGLPIEYRSIADIDWLALE